MRAGARATGACTPLHRPQDRCPPAQRRGCWECCPASSGTMQAAEALKLVIGGGQPLLGRLAMLDAWGARLREIPVVKNPACPVCGENPSITALVTEADACVSPRTPKADTQPQEPDSGGESCRQVGFSEPGTAASPQVQGDGEALRTGVGGCLCGRPEEAPGERRAAGAPGRA